jgi:hypothetical protein
MVWSPPAISTITATNRASTTRNGLRTIFMRYENFYFSVLVDFLDLNAHCWLFCVAVAPEWRQPWQMESLLLAL